jgi:hypothetical protein
MADQDYDREAVDAAYEALADVFGEGYPEAATLTQKGDGIVGHFVRVDEAVDLKSGFAPVDMLVLRAIAGVWHTDEGVERARKGTVYSVAMMHMTLQNRVAAAMPIVTDEVMAIRRGRVFESTFNPGQQAVAYDVVLPNRPKDDDTATETSSAPKTTKGAKRSRRTSNAVPDTPTPGEEPF